MKNNKVIVSAIIALSENQVIGNGNKLPWSLPEDMKWFRYVTMGKPVIMGRKTYESLPAPLKNRYHIIITRDKSYMVDPAIGQVVNSLPHAIDTGKMCAETMGVNEVVIIGGEQIYNQSISLLDRVYVTVIHKKFDGDKYCPDMKLNQFKVLFTKTFTGTPGFTINIFQKEHINSKQELGYFVKNGFQELDMRECAAIA